ncbi:MAG: carbohydrate binding family 9 domain-containing protein [Gemmatimonadetes bacterium]|nr:carbohydrate binding family 9 domain-containing protein [Gemmatimonadota bacterium]
MRSFCLLLPLALALAGAPPTLAQGTRADAPAPTARRQALAVPVEGRPPTVDGRLDDPAWRAAPVLTGFLQKQPAEGEPATERTEVRFLYDGDALYVGARMYARDPARIQAPVSRRDNGSQAEHLWISLDTYHDRRTAYSFGVTASGTRMDWYHPRDDETDIDLSFDPVWEARAERDSLGWTAEMRIPFSQLRFNALPEQVWGLNVDRWIPSTQEDDFWIPVPSKEKGWASRMGELTGIRGIRPTRRLELMPYVASGATFTAEPGVGNPFDDGSRVTARAGGDVKMGLGPNLTLEGTVNPDFGQVEADPAEVNLSAFESFFPEKRPFFIEGSQLLSGNGPSYFYSRRIGAPPRTDLLNGGFFNDVPPASTILGAAKVTGRLASGTSVGALAALTDHESARTFDPAAGVFGRTRVAPRTGFGVVRAQQEFGRDASTAGVILTGVRRELSDGEPLAGLLDRQALTGGADWNLRFRGGEYSLSGYAGFSHVEGDSAAILRLQRSSARYFQRPDAGYVELDPSRTSLSGYTAGVEMDRNSGRHWIWFVGAGAESPGFELNDLGSLSTADGLSAYAQLRYRETRPGPVLRRYAVFVTPSAEWNYGGVRTQGDLFFDADLTWKNYWQSVFTFFVTPRAQSATLTRGGPLAGRPSQWAAIGKLSTSSASRTRWSGRIYYGRNEEDDPTYRISGGVSIRPGPRWQLSVEPNYVRFGLSRQYVATRDGGTAATFGRRYVFARVEQRTFLTDVRLNYTLSPDLTLEVYAEPFAASGRYHDFGELAAARSFRLRDYGTDGTTIVQERDPDTGELSYRVRDGGSEFTVPFRDFNVRSLRSNAVLRWEWRPGSTLFLVWQQNRASDAAEGSPVGVTDLWDALGTRGDNLFVVKMSYWIPVK